MINCAHPDHFSEVLDEDAGWMQRLRGIRANASRKSHAELDNSTELDAGHPQELGEQYAELLRRFPQINVLGGCCGTDHRHVECISAACRRQSRKRRDASAERPASAIVGAVEAGRAAEHLACIGKTCLAAERDPVSTAVVELYAGRRNRLHLLAQS